MAEHEPWRKCSTCKGDIALGAKYFVCSVSTCNTSRAPLVFCSLDCWQSHVPSMRHRDAWAEERRAPSRASPEEARTPSRDSAQKAAIEPVRRHVAPRGETADDEASRTAFLEILIVASKLKAYVREQSEMNTSDRVMTVLSDHLRRLCRMAIREAAQEGRKTVLDRDFIAVLRKFG